MIIQGAGGVDDHDDFQHFVIHPAGKVKAGGLPSVQSCPGSPFIRRNGAHIALQDLLPGQFCGSIQLLHL